MFRLAGAQSKPRKKVSGAHRHHFEMTYENKSSVK